MKAIILSLVFLSTNAFASDVSKLICSGTNMYSSISDRVAAHASFQKIGEGDTVIKKFEVDFLNVTISVYPFFSKQVVSVYSVSNNSFLDLEAKESFGKVEMGTTHGLISCSLIPL